MTLLREGGPIRLAGCKAMCWPWACAYFRGSVTRIYVINYPLWTRSGFLTKLALLDYEVQFGSLYCNADERGWLRCASDRQVSIGNNFCP